MATGSSTGVFSRLFSSFRKLNRKSKEEKDRENSSKYEYLQTESKKREGLNIISETCRSIPKQDQTRNIVSDDLIEVDCKKPEDCEKKIRKDGLIRRLTSSFQKIFSFKKKGQAKNEKLSEDMIPILSEGSEVANKEEVFWDEADKFRNQLGTMPVLETHEEHMNNQENTAEENRGIGNVPVGNLVDIS